MNEEIDTNNLKLLKNLHILVVEDDKDLLVDIKATIEIFCNHVYTAINGKEALEIMDKCPVDMIVSDYVMPLMDGYELCKIIRLTNKNIPIAIMSNYNDNEKLLKLMPLNLTDYIIKPIDYTNLMRVLLNMLQRLKEGGLICERLTKDITYHHINKILKNSDEIISLTKNEVLLLELFLKKKNTLISNDLIEYNVSSDGLSEQAIKSLIHRLRVKIGKKLIVNIKEMGYMLIYDNE